MEGRYLNVPDMNSDSTLVSRSGSPILPETNPEEKGPTMPRKSSFRVWMGAAWTLVVYSILSIGAAVLVLVCVADRHFNVTERSPPVQLIRGTLATPFFPVQTDVITFLSSIIAVLKCALAAWAASLCWNIALFLMERRGLSCRDLKILLKYGLLCPGAYSRDWSTLIISVLLLTSLVAGLSSPILTGSIMWLPNNRLVRGLSTPPAILEDVVDGTLTQLPQDYYNQYELRESITMDGVGRVITGWGSSSDKGVLKRVSNEVETLAINSTIQNVTLPYFQVHSIRWIENRDEVPGIRDGATPAQVISPHVGAAPSSISGLPPGFAVLIPNITTNWSSDPLESSIIHDTRLLLLYYAFEHADYPSGVFYLTQEPPSNAYKLWSQRHYYAFAWVTFSAGIGQCKEYDCVISSPSTIRNNTPVELKPHQLTFQALSMAPVLGVWLARQNASLPDPSSNVNDYVEGVLVRSYSGAWSSLNANIRTSSTLTGYVPSLPSLLAVVDRRRVYIWLWIQLLVALLSALFMIIQSRLSQHPPVGDTSLIAFNLDATTVSKDDPVSGVRKVRHRGSRLMVTHE